MKRENHAFQIPGRDQQGFFTIEGLIAAAIFAIALCAVLLLISKSFKANEGARGVTEQTAMASDLMEDLFKLPYEDEALSNGPHPLPDLAPYTLSYTVSEDTTLRNTKKISVTIQWTQNGVDKSITIDHVKPDII